MHGWPAVAFGSIFLLAGALIVVLSVLGRMRTSSGTPQWLVVVFGALFAAAGTALVTHGVAGVVRTARARRRRAANPREPWTWDHAWNPIGSEDDSGRRIGRVLAFTAFLTLMLVPFNWLSFFSREQQLGFMVITGVFDLVVVAMLAWCAYLVARLMKYGVGLLRFARFPFVIGDEVEVMLARSGPLATLDRLDATLRCVQERYEVTRRGGKHQSTVVSYAVWSETRTSEQGDGRASTERELRWRFVVPPDAPGTSLVMRPPRYWELEVHAVMPGVDYRAVFLVPVYEGRGEGRARLAG